MDDPKIVAYFVRHGSTELNDSGKFRGPLDPPLDENGIQDAHTASDFFKNISVGHAWSSDRRRTETTARAVLQPKGQSYDVDENLRAWNIGYLAGEVKDERASDIDYFQRHPDEQIPEGESLNQFRQRVKSPVLRAIKAGMSGQPSVVFGHSSVLKEVNHIIHGDHMLNTVYPGGVIGVTYDGKKFGVQPLLKPKGGTDGYGS